MASASTGTLYAACDKDDIATVAAFVFTQHGPWACKGIAKFAFKRAVTALAWSCVQFIGTVFADETVGGAGVVDGLKRDMEARGDVVGIAWLDHALNALERVRSGGSGPVPFAPIDVAVWDAAKHEWRKPALPERACATSSLQFFKCADKIRCPGPFPTFATYKCFLCWCNAAFALNIPTELLTSEVEVLTVDPDGNVAEAEPVSLPYLPWSIQHTFFIPQFPYPVVVTSL